MVYFIGPREKGSHVVIFEVNAYNKHVSYSTTVNNYLINQSSEPHPAPGSGRPFEGLEKAAEAVDVLGQNGAFPH